VHGAYHGAHYASFVQRMALCSGYIRKRKRTAALALAIVSVKKGARASASMTLCEFCCAGVGGWWQNQACQHTARPCSQGAQDVAWHASCMLRACGLHAHLRMCVKPGPMSRSAAAVHDVDCVMTCFPKPAVVQLQAAAERQLREKGELPRAACPTEDVRSSRCYVTLRCCCARC
jgi:hypothetical protein